MMALVDSFCLNCDATGAAVREAVAKVVEAVAKVVEAMAEAGSVAVERVVVVRVEVASAWASG